MNKVRPIQADIRNFRKVWTAINSLRPYADCRKVWLKRGPWNEPILCFKRKRKEAEIWLLIPEHLTWIGSVIIFGDLPHVIESAIETLDGP